MNKVTILNNLKREGIRMTSIRSAMIDIFTKKHEPLSAVEILKMLGKYTLRVNKTTVYREITFLLESKIIVPVTLTADQKQYELLKEHHHHLVCQNCHAIEEVDFEEIEELLSKIEKKMKKKNKFSKILHSLEFFGVCEKCF